MKTVVVRLWTPGVIFLSLMLFAAPTKLAAQSNHGCGCQDIPDLLALLDSYRTGQDTAQQLLGTIGPNVLMNEIAPPPNPTRITIGLNLQNALQNSLGGVNPTPCTTSILARQRAAFVRLNERLKSGNKQGQIDFMPAQTWLRYSIESYRSASDDILGILRAMPNTCRPGYWFGTIRAVETHQMTTTVTVVPRSRTMLGGEQVSGENTIRNGIIRLSGIVSNPSSTVGSWTATGTSTFNAVSRTLTRCEGGGLKGALPLDQTVTGGLHRQLNNSGSITSPTVVSISGPDDAGQFSVSFEIPGMAILQNGTETVTSSGGCPGSEIFNRGTGINGIKGELDAQSGTVNVPRIPGEPERLSGSQMIDLTPEILPTNVTASHKIQVTVNLYKFRP